MGGILPTVGISLSDALASASNRSTSRPQNGLPIKVKRSTGECTAFCVKKVGFSFLSHAPITTSGEQRQHKETQVPLYLIERNFAEQLNVSRDAATAVTQVNADAGIQWLFSFLSADKKKTYCLYEAPNPEAIREAARKLNLPADVIVELGDQRINPAAPGLFSPTRGA